MPVSICFLVVSCLISGFMLGRMGCYTFDGWFVLGSKPEDHKIELTMDDQDLPYCRYITLKVVTDEPEERESQ